jgi:hypothetical protein
MGDGYRTMVCAAVPFSRQAGNARRASAAKPLHAAGAREAIAAPRYLIHSNKRG